MTHKGILFFFFGKVALRQIHKFTIFITITAAQQAQYLSQFIIVSCVCVCVYVGKWEEKFSTIFSRINFHILMEVSSQVVCYISKNFTIYIQDIKIQAPFFYSHYNNSDIFVLSSIPSFHSVTNFHFTVSNILMLYMCYTLFNWTQFFLFVYLDTEREKI